jgi:hypothetical protein
MLLPIQLCLSIRHDVLKAVFSFYGFPNKIRCAFYVSDARSRPSSHPKTLHNSASTTLYSILTCRYTYQRCVKVQKLYISSRSAFQICKVQNPTRRAIRSTEFCTVALNICRPSHNNLLHITCLVLEVSRWLLDF